MRTNRLLSGTTAGQIAQKLDAQDGNQDGKISASVWNDFVKDKGGKQIKNYITVENALKSITTYSVKNSAKIKGEKSDNVAKSWYNNLNTNAQRAKTPAGTQDLNNGTLVGQLAQKLDAQDGNQDGKISASVWNDFVKNKGGKQIKSFISVENALKSLTTYAIKIASKSRGKNSDKIAQKWLSSLNSQGSNPTPENKPVAQPPKNNENKPAQNPDKPKANGNAPSGKQDIPNVNKRYPERAGKTIKSSDGTTTVYDANGYVKKMEKNGRVILEVNRENNKPVIPNKDNNLPARKHLPSNLNKRYPERAGQSIKNADGTTTIYDAKGYIELIENSCGRDILCVPRRNQNGMAEAFIETEYDKNCEPCKSISRDGKGNLKDYTVYFEDSKGRGLFRKYDASGNLLVDAA